MKAHETARTKSTEVAKVITRASSSRELKDVQRMQKERKEARKHAMTATAAAGTPASVQLGIVAQLCTFVFSTGKAIVRAAAVAAQEKAADSFLQLSSNSADSDRERHMEYLRMREEAILTATNQVRYCCVCVRRQNLSDTSMLRGHRTLLRASKSSSRLCRPPCKASSELSSSSLPWSRSLNQRSRIKSGRLCSVCSFGVCGRLGNVPHCCRVTRASGGDDERVIQH